MFAGGGEKQLQHLRIILGLDHLPHHCFGKVAGNGEQVAAYLVRGHVEVFFHTADTGHVDRVDLGAEKLQHFPPLSGRQSLHIIKQRAEQIRRQRVFHLRHRQFVHMAGEKPA